jgi:hypothetical protein
LADFLDSSPLKTFVQMNRILVGSIYGKFSVTIAQSTNQKQELPVAAMFVDKSGHNEHSL